MSVSQFLFHLFIITFANSLIIIVVSSYCHSAYIMSFIVWPSILSSDNLEAAGASSCPYHWILFQLLFLENQDYLHLRHLLLSLVYFHPIAKRKEKKNAKTTRIESEHACLCACACVCACLCLHLCLYVCSDVPRFHWCSGLCALVHACICSCVCLCTHVFVFVCTCACVHLYLHASLHVRILRACVWVCVRVCACGKVGWEMDMISIWLPTLPVRLCSTKLISLGIHSKSIWDRSYHEYDSLFSTTLLHSNNF